jgi:hypothetical protein
LITAHGSLGDLDRRAEHESFRDVRSAHEARAGDRVTGRERTEDREMTTCLPPGAGMKTPPLEPLVSPCRT